MTTNRFSLIVALSMIAALAVLSLSMLKLPSKPVVSNSGSSSHDQIELVRAERYIAAAAQQAYLDQRRGEWTAGNAAQGVRPAGGYRPADDFVGARPATNAQIGGFRPSDDFVGTAP